MSTSKYAQTRHALRLDLACGHSASDSHAGRRVCSAHRLSTSKQMPTLFISTELYGKIAC